MQDNNLTSNIDRIWRLPDQLRVLKPEAVGLLDRANERSWQVVQPVLLELVRLLIASLIGNHSGLQRRSRTAYENGLTDTKIAELGVHRTSEAFSQLEKDCFAFSEQFVIDVSSITPADVARLGRHFAGEHLNEFVIALYVTECTQRLEMVCPLLLATSPAVPDHSAIGGGRANRQSVSEDARPSLQGVLEEYEGAVVRGTALDPIITEMVRLRCARTHDCQICKTLRLADARAAGADDAMTMKVDFYERSDLDERTKIALRITDAVITRPDALADTVVNQARSLLSQDQLAELCLDITRWSTQKILVSLGTDTADALPKNEDGESFFSFGEDGHVVVLPANAARGLRVASP
jgi:alkylhydroperoxidase family enzyme